MKRTLGVVFASVFAAVMAAHGSYAAVNDFTVLSLHTDYYLGADKEGRSTLKTVETVVADFSANSQRAIDRIIAKTYDGHPTSLAIVSVVDQAGKPWQYTVTSSGDNEVIHSVVPSDATGQQTFVLTYTQRDVTKYRPNPGVHEFTQRVNDVQWQAVPKIDVVLHADTNIAPTLNKTVTCTVGSVACQISETGSTVTASAEKVSAGAAMDITVGFTAGTFRGYQPTLRDRVTENGPMIFGAGIVIIMIVIAGLFFIRKKRR